MLLINAGIDLYTDKASGFISTINTLNDAPYNVRKTYNRENGDIKVTQYMEDDTKNFLYCQTMEGGVGKWFTNNSSCFYRVFSVLQ